MSYRPAPRRRFNNELQRMSFPRRLALMKMMAGIQCFQSCRFLPLDSRFRGNDMENIIVA